jgi:hypothetical protein
MWPGAERRRVILRVGPASSGRKEGRRYVTAARPTRAAACGWALEDTADS